MIMPKVATLLLVAALLPCRATSKKLKIFILAGQSNMRGFANMGHLQTLALSGDEEFSKYWNTTTDDFNVRSDVRISVHDATPELPAGDLSVGYGWWIPKEYFGPEVGFGWTVGDAYDDDILLVKMAVGGSSLGVSWKSPSAPLAVDDNGDVIQNAGRLYRELIALVKDVTTNLEVYVPGYDADDGDSYEIAGFAWLQGWFDAFDNGMRNEYGNNLSFFIEDILSEFGNPNMPFLIGELGQFGSPTYALPVTVIRYLQQEAASRFGDNVVFVPTAQFFDRSITETFGSIAHYNGRADIMIRIGNAFGEEILRQLQTPAPAGVVSLFPSVAPSVSPSSGPPVSDKPACSIQDCFIMCDPRFAGNLPVYVPCDESICSCNQSSPPTPSPIEDSPSSIPSDVPSSIPSSLPSVVPSLSLMPSMPVTTDMIQESPTLVELVADFPSFPAPSIRQDGGGSTQDKSAVTDIQKDAESPP